jgi:hypothetical protein
MQIDARCQASAYHIQVDVFGVPVEQLTLIAAKIGQVPCIVNAYWYRV